MIHLIALLSSLAIVPAMQQSIVYTQIASYQKDMCAEQPLVIVSQRGGSCSIPGAPLSSCSSFSDPSSVYASQRTVCNQKPLNMSGVVQLFVAEYAWTDNGGCSGDPQSVTAYMADALCKPVPAGGQNSYSYLSVNCNGGSPIYRYCKDASCSNCVESQYSGKCETIGAMASRQHVCVNPPRGKGGVIVIGGDDDSSATGLLTGGGGYTAALGSLLALLF